MPAFILLSLIQSCHNSGSIITYPAIPGLETSELYTVTVNGESVWTEKVRTRMDIEKLDDWFTSEPFTRVQQEIHIASCSGRGTLRIRIKASVPLAEVRIRPASRQIVAAIKGNMFEFILPGPDKLYIEVNDLPPLCLLIHPPESNVPAKNDTDVRYFSPGVHRPGLMTMNNNEKIYIAGGALVYGGIRADSVSNIKVYGRGILDGNFEHSRMVLIKNCDNVEFNGIMIRNGRSWTNTVINCDSVKYEDVAVVSFGPGGDGINPLGSRHFMINNCFFRCTDDCMAIKSPDTTHVVRDILVTNNTMAGYAFSDGITIGFETNGPLIEDVTVRNCDILMARGGSRVDGHSAFSIICDGPAMIRNILFENIRVEQPVLKLFELHITDGTKYGDNPPGHIRDISLKNISWQTTGPVILQGLDTAHRVENVTFENCSAGGRLLKGTDDDVFRINEYVSGVIVR